MSINIKLIPVFILLPFILLAAPEGNDAADARYNTLSGTIKDATSGETLIGATLFVEPIGRGTVSNMYGYYSMRIEPATYKLRYSFVGYESVLLDIFFAGDTVINIEMQPSQLNLEEVIVRGEAKNENISRAQMSVTRLDTRAIKQIPAFMGETDLIKAIQLLPGVQATAEGGSGFSVRGGSPDQNLILLDEATVYNPVHLMGFFSVFNNDAIKNVELYKGDIPSVYGGRLSSVVDVRMNEGNVKKYSGTGGIGTISSRLTLEGPIQKDKSSFMVAGRRTYADLFLALSSDPVIRDNTLYFYDLNMKANYTFSDKHRIFISGYFGKDIFKNDDFGIGWGNSSFTLRWNNLINKNLFSNTSLIYSRFNYNLGVPESQPNAFDWQASMADHSFRNDYTWYAGANNTLRFGLSATFHQFQPGIAEGLGSETAFNKFELPRNQAFQSGIYVSNEQKIGNRLNLSYGLRLSMFNNVGKATQFIFNEDFVKVDSVVYEKWDFFNTYMALEPRMSLAWVLNESSSVKAAYTRNVQYIHLAQNSTAGTPLDVWFPSSPNVKPQFGDQFSLGYFRNFLGGNLETSLEGFYKLNHNAIDFKDHAELLLNEYLEGEFRYGDAWSYGTELLVRLVEGRLNGWVSYTWSRTFRKMADINNGKAYPASYDKPHDISIVMNYEISKKFMLGANWVYTTGSPVTFPTGRFQIGQTIAPVYSDRNAYRLPDYHRLDLSLTYMPSQKAGRKWHSEWNLSVYNAYYRKNPWVINFINDRENPGVTYAEMTYLFGILPAITYNFKF
jgi:hypothetical protein